MDPLGLDAARAVAVILSGGGRSDDKHLKRMDAFVVRNYGKPGAAPKDGVGATGQDELRRSVKASGKDDRAMLADLSTGAGKLANDKAETKTLALIVHGNSRGFGRENPGNWLMAEEVSEVKQYRSDLSLMDKALARAQASGNADEIQARTDAIAQYKSDNRAAGDLSAAFGRAARALEVAGVSSVELQGCNVADDLLFKDQFGELLSTKDHKVTVGAFSKDVVSYANGDVGVEGGEKSHTSLPTPDRN